MLIDSPRLTDADRAAWERLERYDMALARSPRLNRRQTRAVQVLTDFANKGPCYVSTSWGKDSTVLTHILAISGLSLPLVWVRVRHWENPDCLLVRDDMLKKYPHLANTYEEIEVDATAVRWWHQGADLAPKTQRTSRGGFNIAGRRHGNRHVSGVRGEESRIRERVMGMWGEAGPRACRPIGNWTAVEVFAYLHKHHLPVHPAYAMSHGGTLDRRWLRVSSLGGIRGSEKGRSDWEMHYYGDIITQGQKAEETP